MAPLMLGIRRRWAALVAVTLVGWGGVAPAVAVAAALPANTITITAVVAPARYVLVRGGKIVKVFSNSPEAPRPLAYYGSLHNRPRPLTPAINRQYNALLPKLPTHHVGVIYSAAAVKKVGWQRWFGQLSVLPRLLRN